MEPFYRFFFQRSHFIILWLVQSLLRMLREKKFIVDAHKKNSYLHDLHIWQKYF